MGDIKRASFVMEDPVPHIGEEKMSHGEPSLVEHEKSGIDIGEYEDKEYIPDDSDDFIDPRLKNYPIPLVAKTVDLRNDPTEPILTFRYWVLSTFWVVVGCGIATFYYFKPYTLTLTSYAVQLLSWGMGVAMARYLPTHQYSTFGHKWSFNPGPWNAKEHALIVVSYWGSCYTAYGLGPLSAMEMYYGKKVNAGWGILFLITTQMIGYGFAGLFRDILVRPPKIYYPGVLPNVSLLNAMHRNPTMAKNAIRFFGIVAVSAFIYEWIPSLIFPLLTTLPLICYFGHGNWIAYILGSGNYGFGLFNISLDWNYASFWSPLYTPLWANAHQYGFAIFLCWGLYPLLYFTNALNSKNFAPMSSGTFDKDGSTYNTSRILNPDFTLNQEAMDAYSRPYWSTPYAMYFFWGFAASTGAMLYSVLYYGYDSYFAIKEAWFNRRVHEDDPYLQLMSFDPRVPHWWYGVLLVICAALSFATIYIGGFELPWWGFILICLIAWVFTFPNGILWGIANTQVGMSFLSEIIAGSLFPGKPMAVLSCMVYGRQILEQNLNLISDYKFGFYMKIPEKEMFVGQVWGTLLGPFVNYALMRVVINGIGVETLTGVKHSTSWLALKTKNFYSLSILWGVLGPREFFANGSPYKFVYYGFFLGPIAVLLVWMLHKRKPGWKLEERFNPVMLFNGGLWFPVYTTTNLFTSALFSMFFMGYVYRYHPVWWRKYNYLLGVGLDCGTQLMTTVMTFGISLPGVSFPYWWGNSATGYTDRCFPPSTLPPAAQN